MKNKRGSPHVDELGINDFTCRVKPEKGVDQIIEDCSGGVKHPLESAMTLLFQSLAEIHRLQRKAREGSDG